jgi:hypothetical protein
MPEYDHSICSYEEKANGLSLTELTTAIPLSIETEPDTEFDAPGVTVLLLEIHGKESGHCTSHCEDVSG